MTDSNLTQPEVATQLDLFESIYTILHADSREAVKILDLDDSQFNRRNFVRTAFALIEGLTFGLKSWALSHPRNELTTAESLLLSEITYDLKENGTIREISTRLGTLPNIRFAFKAVSKAEKIEDPLDTSLPGWELINKAMKIRHRLTHPKSKETLVVSDDELTIVLDAQEFFLNKAIELISRSVIKLTKEAEDLKKVLEGESS